MEGDFANKFETVVGRAFLRDKLAKLDSDIRRTPPRLESTNNPVMRYLRGTTDLGSRRIFYYRRRPARLTDEVYFNFTSRLLSYLSKEMAANENYKKQSIEKLLSRDEGPFLSTIAELICAGFLKSIGQEVRFNSSAEEGMPDVISTRKGVEVGHDAKLFADEDILLVSKVNRMLPDFARDYKNVRDVTLQVMVYDVKGFNAKKLKDSVEKFLNGTTNNANGMMITSFDYKGDEGLEINLKRTNFSLRIIPSQPLDQAISNFASSLAHSIEQIKAAGLNAGISWGFFTHDNNYGSKQMIVQQVTDVIPKHVKSGFGLVMMELRPVVKDGFITLKCQVFVIGLPPSIDLTQSKLEAFLDTLNIKS